MDTRTAALPNTYPTSRRTLTSESAPSQATLSGRGKTVDSPQVAGIDQSIVGAVNASRIAALVGPQGQSPTDRPLRPAETAHQGYRQTRLNDDTVPPASFTF